MYFRNQLGNILIITSLAIIVFIYYPLWQLVFPLSLPGNLSAISGEYILIPKIYAWAPLIENVNPANESQYMKALSEGVAVAQGSAVIGTPGNIFLFAHSSEEPWLITRYNVAFLKLGQLKSGDEVILGKNFRQYHYRVTGSKVVSPTEVAYLNHPVAPLTLMTCTPIGTAWKRLLVFAQPE